MAIGTIPRSNIKDAVVELLQTIQPTNRPTPSDDLYFTAVRNVWRGPQRTKTRIPADLRPAVIVSDRTNEYRPTMSRQLDSFLVLDLTLYTVAGTAVFQEVDAEDRLDALTDDVKACLLQNQTLQRAGRRYASQIKLLADETANVTDDGLCQRQLLIQILYQDNYTISRNDGGDPI